MIKKATKIAFAVLLVVLFLHMRHHRANLNTSTEEKNSQATSLLQTNMRNHKNHLNSKPYRVGNSIIEPVIFYAQKSEYSTEKIVRKGILTLRDNAKGTVLICHGFMCDKFDVIFLRTFFQDYNVMVFDFRAHGEKTDEEYCTMGKEEAFDVIAAATFLKNHPKLKNTKLFGYGFSMGAASLIEAEARQHLFEGLILDCPYDSSENMIKIALSKIKFDILGYSFEMPGKRLLEKYAFHPYVQSLIKNLIKTVARFDGPDVRTKVTKFSTAQSIKKISIPCFFIHCKHDDKVPISAMKNVFHNASGFKRLWLTGGRGHFDSVFFSPEKYILLINKFLQEILNGTLAQYAEAEIIEDSNEQL